MKTESNTRNTNNDKCDTQKAKKQTSSHAEQVREQTTESERCVN